METLRTFPDLRRQSRGVQGVQSSWIPGGEYGGGGNFTKRELWTHAAGPPMDLLSSGQFVCGRKLPAPGESSI